MLKRFLHWANLYHAPVYQVAFMVWGCRTCGKIADADPDVGGWAPYNWHHEAK